MATLRFRFLRFLLGHSRLLAGAVCGFLTALLSGSIGMPDTLTRGLVGWNAGVLVYLLLTFWMMWRADRESDARRVVVHDEGRWLVLGLSMIAVIASLFAAVAELVAVRGSSGWVRNFHLGCAAVTLTSSWVFIHVMFAVHYAHEFDLDVSRGGKGGLSFPGDDVLRYSDFLYFSMVIGTSAQTADVSLCSRVMRRWGLVHCGLSFFYNTTVVALTVNIGAGLF